MRAWIERQLAAVALRSYAEAIVESLDAGLAVVDATLRVTSANEAFCRVAGTGPAGAVDRGLDECLPVPGLVEAARAVLLTLVPRSNLFLEHQVDGRRRLLRANLVPARQAEGAVGVVVALEDVTDVQLLRLAAARSEELFRVTFEQAAVGIAHLSPEGRCIRVNPRLGQITGHNLTELVGASLSELLPAEDWADHQQRAAELLEGRSRSVSVQHRLHRNSGEPVWVHSTLSLVRDAEDRPDYFIAVFEDVTERRRAEETLARTEEQYRQAQKMEAVGRLAGGVAHDFNNILTAILGYADLLAGRVPDDASLREYVAEIRGATERAASLTQQLLAFSRRQVLQPRVLDLNAVVGELQRMLRRLIGEDLMLVTDLAPELGSVRADQGQIEQVLLNLAVNARDAMPAGGTLTLATRNASFGGDGPGERSGIPPGDYVVLSVCDEGQGMDAATRERVFEPFFTTKGVGKGTGLGLSMVHGIVSQSGGHVWVESEIDRGARFHIALPRVEDRADHDAEGAGLEAGPSGRGTVLLVEDDAGVRGLSRTLLAGAGYEVLEAGDALAAVERIRDHGRRIDLLLTDVIMPGLDGKELSRLLSAECPGLAVLFMSGYAEDVIVHHGALEEGVALLKKPFTPAALLAAVRRAIDCAPKNGAGTEGA